MLKLTRYEYNIRGKGYSVPMSGDSIQLNTTGNVTDLLASMGMSFDTEGGGSAVEEKTFDLKMVFTSLQTAATAIKALISEAQESKIGKLWCHSNSTNTDYNLLCRIKAISPPEYCKGNAIKFTVTFIATWPFWIKETVVNPYTGGAAIAIPTERKWTIDFVSRTQTEDNTQRLKFLIFGVMPWYFEIGNSSITTALELRFADKSLNYGWAGYNIASIDSMIPFTIYDPSANWKIQALKGPTEQVPMAVTILEFYEVPI